MIFLALLLALSLAYNFHQYQNKKTTKRQMSVDARQLLHDLTNGGAIVKVTVIDPTGLLIYRGGE